MKRLLCILLCAGFLAMLPMTAAADGAEATPYKSTYTKEFEGTTLNVYNWGEYIDESIFEDFEDLTGIRVNYSTYETNESMYTKLVAGGASYDIIIPSDYMVARLINEDRLEKLDWAHIPNKPFTDPTLDTTTYDPTNEYSIPFTWGFVGVVYNSKYITEPVTGFVDLWNGNYAGKILTMNNSRDVFAIALSRLGMDYNTEDPADWQKALDLLRQQKPLLQGYVTDEIYNKMESGEAWIAPCYVGDYLAMVENNPDLRFAYPTEGSNTFIDAVCIPKGSKNKAAAEVFINFLCEPEIALRNINEIWYFTPNTVTAEMEDYFLACEVADESLLQLLEDKTPQTKGQIFHALSPSTQKNLEELWLTLKRSSVGWYVYAVLGGALALALLLAVIRRIKKKKAEALYESDYGRSA